MPAVGGWFVIANGENVGRPRLAGWSLAAIKGEATGPDDDGWLAYGICPRCFAMVLADAQHTYGDQTWAHEQWHAATDYPIPDHIRPT